MPLGHYVIGICTRFQTTPKISDLTACLCCRVASSLPQQTPLSEPASPTQSTPVDTSSPTPDAVPNNQPATSPPLGSTSILNDKASAIEECPRNGQEAASQQSQTASSGMVSTESTSDPEVSVHSKDLASTQGPPQPAADEVSARAQQVGPPSAGSNAYLLKVIPLLPPEELPAEATAAPAPDAPLSEAAAGSSQAPHANARWQEGVAELAHKDRDESAQVDSNSDTPCDQQPETQPDEKAEQPQAVQACISAEKPAVSANSIEDGAKVDAELAYEPQLQVAADEAAATAATDSNFEPADAQLGVAPTSAPASVLGNVPEAADAEPETPPQEAEPQTSQDQSAATQQTTVTETLPALQPTSALSNIAEPIDVDSVTTSQEADLQLQPDQSATKQQTSMTTTASIECLTEDNTVLAPTPTTDTDLMVAEDELHDKVAYLLGAPASNTSQLSQATDTEGPSASSQEVHESTALQSEVSQSQLIAADDTPSCALPIESAASSSLAKPAEPELTAHQPAPDPLQHATAAQEVTEASLGLSRDNAGAEGVTQALPGSSSDTPDGGDSGAQPWPQQLPEPANMTDR